MDWPGCSCSLASSFKTIKDAGLNIR